MPKTMHERFKAPFGIEIPLPPWAVSALAGVVIIGVAVWVWQTVYHDPSRQILTIKQANEQLAADVAEYGRHAMEAPSAHQAFTDTDGELTLRVYADHCVMIQSSSRAGTFVKLVQDPAKTQQVPRARLGWPALVPTVLAATAAGTCLNPHPGPFSWWYGARRGEWVEVWRQWGDGCQHVQLLHVPSQSWATNGDGSPAVQWTSCVH